MKSSGDKAGLLASMASTLGVSAGSDAAASARASKEDTRAGLVARALELSAKDAERVLGFVTPALVEEFKARGVTVIEPIPGRTGYASFSSGA
jgi:hypothetical protein